MPSQMSAALVPIHPAFFALSNNVVSANPARPRGAGSATSGTLAADVGASRTAMLSSKAEIQNETARSYPAGSAQLPHLLSGRSTASRSEYGLRSSYQRP